MSVSDVTSRARSGDRTAFDELTEPHRRELLVHCYRMLGSIQDAEDALQETLLAAWQGIGSFEGRASIRTWLYRIATNRCLNALRSAGRRPIKEFDIAALELPEPTGFGEVVWLEPFPDTLLEGARFAPSGPEAHYEQTEALSLAFITALQLLPPRQRAVLILRDVLGYHADEVAELVGASVQAVNSALKRARASLRAGTTDRRDAPPPRDSAAERTLVDKFVRAYQSGDVDGLIELLTADVRLSMPPIPLEYQGRDVVAGFYSHVMTRGRRYHLVPTRANGQVAFGAYVDAPGDGVRHGAGLLVLTLRGELVSELTRFDNDVFPVFGLPRSLT